MALREGAKELKYLYQFLNWLQTALQLDYNFKCPTILIDNEAAESLAKNPVFHKRTKYINAYYHFTRELVKRGLIEIKHTTSRENIADWFTKPIPKPLFEELRRESSIY